MTLLAHAAPITYRFPLPIWVYLVAAGAAVLLSAPAASLVRVDRTPWRSRNLYPALRRLRLGPIGLALCTILLGFALVGGFGATTTQSRELFENPVTVLTWIVLWVGLGIVSALVGNVWDFVSPLNAAARALDRALARRGVSPLPYPERIGRWPAFVLVLVWTWLELVWEPAKEPVPLAAILTGYIVVTLLLCSVYGAEAWLANGELFTVFARTLARFAPLELSPRSPDEWLATPREEREVRLRAYGTGLTERPLPPGGGAFVVALLATVVYDGFSQTQRYLDVQGRLFDASSWFESHLQVLNTLLLAIAVALFWLAFLAVCGLVGPGGEGARATARRYAPTLIPIAGVYFIAHYLAYLLLGGQSLVAVLVDPLGRSWDPGGLGEYGLWKGITPAGAVWWIQVVVIVWGHVAGVVAAHRVALRTERRNPVLAQAPLVLLMVAYTVAGLWVLAQQIRA